MKRIMLLFLLIICVSGILFGKVHWENKLESVSLSADAKENNPPKVTTKKELTNMDQLMTNLQPDLREKVQQIISDGKTVKIEAVGSGATSDDTGAWPSILRSELDDSYGRGSFSINVRSFGEKTSLEAMREIRDQGIESTPDILLLEPFLLKDNGEIRIEDSLDAVTNIISSYRNVNEDLIIILQPSNPLYDSKFYPLQVKKLKDYAEKNDYIYLNHWKAWPELDNVEMEDYLTGDSKPNHKGHQIWAKYLVDYFTGK